MRTEKRAAGTFRSLSNRNFRLYYFGQMVSQAGTFMQTVAQAWLVFQLTGSGTALGLVPLLQFTPMLLFGAYGGLIADRYNRRRVYMCSQVLACTEATLLGVLTVTGSVQLWMVYTLAFVLGLINVVDQPVRNTFIYDMVGPGDLTNAVSLQMTIGSASRAVGPAIAGVIIATFDVGTCFLINAASYVAVLISLALMRSSELHPVAPTVRQPGQFREGVRYVWATRDLFALLVFIAIFLGLAWEFEVALPLLAKRTFGGGAGLYGLMSSFLGVGALCGGMIMARYGRAAKRTVYIGGVAVGGALLLSAVAPWLWFEMLALGLVGITSCVTAASSSAMTQLITEPKMRGRVMGLYTVGSIGTRPIGGIIVGYVGQHIGPRASMAFCAVCVGGALLLLYVLGVGARSPHSMTAVSEIAVT